MNGPPKTGSIGWRDLTVEDAAGVRDFYEAVVGWTHEAVEMGGYTDFSMIDSTGETVAGICYARGENADLPPQWLIYITVDDIEQSLASCRKMGGHVVIAPRPLGEGTVAVIQDPAGAVCALFGKP